MRKILYSPGFGAGWSSWNSNKVAKKMIEYQQIITFLENGGSFKKNECGGLNEENLHPLLKQLQDECKKEFNEDYICVFGGAGFSCKTS